MSAPLRVIKPGTALERGSEGGSVAGQDFKYYLERLVKMVPGEIIGLYLIGSGLIPDDQVIGLLVWSIICLVGVVVVRAYGTADKEAGVPTDWMQVGIATVAFAIWLYSIGGPFKAYGIHIPYVGSLLVLAWSFFVPIIYKGAEA